MGVLAIILAMANGALILMTVATLLILRRTSRACLKSMNVTSDAYNTLKTQMENNDRRILETIQEVTQVLLERIRLSSIITEMVTQEQSDAPDALIDGTIPEVSTTSLDDGCIDDVKLLKDILPVHKKCNNKRKD